MLSILSQLKVNVINLVPSYLPDIITLLLITYLVKQITDNNNPLTIKTSLAQPDPLPNRYAEKGSGDNHAPWLFYSQDFGLWLVNIFLSFPRQPSVK